MVPEGWERREIGENITFSGGAQPPRDHFISEPKDGYIRLIQIRDYKSDKFATYIPKNLARKFCNDDDVMIGRYGPPIFQILRGIEGAYNVALIKATPKPDVDKSFMFYFLKRDPLLRFIESFQQRTSGQTGIEMDMLKAYPMPLPPLPEQKKIAQILATWDQAITATERLLENSQQRKKGLMQQLLTGKKRLPGFEGEWEAKPISQTGKIISGGTPDTNDDDLWNGNVQWLTPTDITALKTHFIYDTPRKITDKGVKESSATLMPAGSLCVCTRASVGLMAISTTPITTNQGFKSVVPNTKHDVEFLYYLFSFHRYVFIRYSSGSTFMELSKKDFAKITFNYPPLAEQEAIARVLASASDEIEQLEKRIACLKQEKKALMQQLLTGKRRVQVDTEAA